MQPICKKMPLDSLGITLPPDSQTSHLLYLGKELHAALMLTQRGNKKILNFIAGDSNKNEKFSIWLKNPQGKVDEEIANQAGSALRNFCQMQNATPENDISLIE